MTPDNSTLQALAPAARVGPAAVRGRVLLTLSDGPDEGVAVATRRAWAWARIHHAELWIARILPPTKGAAPTVTIGRRWRSGQLARTVVRTGHFVDETAALACELGVHTIVVNPSDLSRGAAAALAHRTDAAVLIARSPRPSGAVIAATDLEAQWAPVLQTAAELATLLEVPMAVLHNVSPVIVLPSAFTMDGTAAPSIVQVEQLVEGARRELMRALGSFPGSPEAIVATHTNARSAILETAATRDADLIVVGAYRSSTLRRRVLGGVATTIALEAPQSVLVVPVEGRS